LAIANTVFLNHASNGISAVLPDIPVEQIQAAVAGAGSKFLKNLDVKVQAEVLHAILGGMKNVWILGMTAGALTIVLSLLMKREKLFMKYSGGV
jgi:hypothetical protein